MSAPEKDTAPSARSFSWSLLVLIVTAGLMAFLASYPFATSKAGSTPLALGVLLIAAWCLGLAAEKLRLPRLTGYIVAGILVGPQLTGFVSAEQVSDLRLVDDLALTFIALVAGGELRFALLRGRLAGISAWIGGQTLITPLVVGGGLLLAGPFIPGAPQSPAALFALALVISALSLARSPAATVVVIEESSARGPFTNTTLATTITLDTAVILLFASAVAIAEALVSPGGAFRLQLLGGLSVDLAISIALGIAIGFVVILAIRLFDIDLPVLLAAIAFLITQLSREISHIVAAELDVQMHLEPLLMGLTAGVVVRNASRKAESFTHALERVAPPIYVAFFALTGAALEVRSLADTWPLALLLVGLRGGGLYLGSWLGSRIAGDPPAWRRVAGFTSIAQAGVSLGLAAELARRFPEWGTTFVSPIVAAITINQVVGPILLARALDTVGEAGAGSEEPELEAEAQTAPG